MTNEMMRPCTLWGQTFDACDVKAVNDYLTFEEESASPSMGYSCGVLIRAPFKGDIASPVYKNKRESYKAIIEAITTIADALNAPVLATEEVLAGLPSFPDEDEYGYHGGFRLVSYCFCFGTTELLPCITINGKWFCKDITVTAEGEYQIQAYNCDKTLEYLLQFTLDGVRKENK
jgi:hypothetical protein